MIRRQTIAGMNQMDANKFSDFRRRVFANHEITSAGAQLKSTQASKEGMNSMAAL